MTEQAHLLLVEDHQDIAEMVYDYLEQQSYNVDYAADGRTALNLALSNHYDLIILDLMLPSISGLTVCERLRQQAHHQMLILMLTARDTLDDKITGLDMGADDYLVKPFELPELAARIRALLRRERSQQQVEILQVDDLSLDTSTWLLKRNHQVLTLPPIGLKILTVLMRASPHVVDRNELERQVWGSELPDSDVLRSHLYSLRKVIDKPFKTALLQTLPGLGYCLRSDSNPSS